jgi:hypothetical protein
MTATIWILTKQRKPLFPSNGLRFWKAHSFLEGFQALPLCLSGNNMLINQSTEHWLYLGSGSSLPVSHRTGSILIPGQSMSYLWGTKWNRDRFLSDYFRFPFSGSSHPRCLDVTGFYSSDRMHSLRGTNLDRRNRWLFKHISPFTKRVQETGYIALDEISKSNAITRRLPQTHLLTYAVPGLQIF